MKTIQLKANIGEDGLLKIETPTEYKNIAADVVLVLSPVRDETKCLHRARSAGLL